MKNEDSELLQVAVAEHLKLLQKKQTFEVAAKALTTIVQERYVRATPAEQHSVRVDVEFSCHSFLVTLISAWFDKFVSIYLKFGMTHKTLSPGYHTILGDAIAVGR